MRRLLMLFSLFFLLTVSLTQAQIPQTINYQGVLTDNAGQVVADDNYALTFRLYDALSGGNMLWEESRMVPVEKGLFDVILGEVVPINLLFNNQYWLGITINTGSELEPRTKLSSVAYSLNTKNIVDSSITTSKIVDGAITSQKIDSNAVVKSLNGLKDSVNLVPGTNVTITPSGNNLTISATPGGGGSIGGSGTANYVSKFTSLNTIGNSIIYENDGKVGIGITDFSTYGQQAKFAVKGYCMFDSVRISGTDWAENTIYIERPDGLGIVNKTGPIIFRTGGDQTDSNRVIIDINGNVGIGTSTPDAKLELSGSDALINGLTIGTGKSNISNNSALGDRALYFNTTGYGNTAVGSGTLYENTTGYENTANGGKSLFSNTTGYWNTANGFYALHSNISGHENTANGFGALYNNTIGFENTANGSGALSNNTEGFDNTAIGSKALFSNTTGEYNTANGYNSLYSNTTGNENTAIGCKALYFNTAGYDNTANGYQTLYFNTEGHENTAIGFQTLYYNTVGVYNTAIGRYALSQNTTGNGNTAVGWYAGPYYLETNLENTTALGYMAYTHADNQVRIGNSFVTSIGGYAGWTNFSDGRYKLAVNENVKGLDFIVKLRPITYQLDVNKLSADLKENQRRDEKGNITIESSETDIKSRNEKSQIVYTGFVAQEVEQAAKEIGFDFSGVDAPKNANDFYGLRYAEFVVPLVKAVQEQQKIIEELTRRIEQLERK